MPAVADRSPRLQTLAMAMPEDPFQPLESAVDSAREQLRALRQRLRSLERANGELRRENDRLRSRLESGAEDRKRLEALESERQAVRERVIRALGVLEGEADVDG